MTAPPTKPETTYVVEHYCPRAGAPELERIASALGTAADAATAEGRPVRLACSILFREDELCLHVLATASAEAAAEVVELAAIAAERVLPVTVRFRT